jgi:hypothetical protein
MAPLRLRTRSKDQIRQGRDAGIVFCILMIKSILSGYRGGKEEVPQAYLTYVEETDDATNKGSRIKEA